jgi:hypothetical protein
MTTPSGIADRSRNGLIIDAGPRQPVWPRVNVLEIRIEFPNRQ